ncbi:unnamed protein product [Symbiodinium sp. CCMP2592]|nr:unnamed protein product [Symbiodinium sp. CCMP2592]CAE7744640.1 unnamed protein product [Symbiodinium sp. CCMP2592]
MLVYGFSGHCSSAAADFACGRGWRLGASAAAATEEQVATVEWAYIHMPLSVLVDLELEPLKMVGQRDVYCAAKYCLEHRLVAYVEEQNTVHGIAPSRAQMLDVALASIPAAAPSCVKERLVSLVQGTPRKERKYLAAFRRRWSARYGCLRTEDVVDVAERRQKATVFHQWMNHIWRDAAKPVLVVNMDETSVVRHPTGLWGTVLKGPTNKPRRDHGTLSDRRGSLSFLASICPDSDVQGILPQILLANEHQVSLTVLRRLQASGSLPPNMHIWREASGWTTHAIMRRYLSFLARSLGEVVAQRTVVLLVDVNRAHIDHSILLHARRLSIRMCFVPARMTRWLQPADTAMFARFKAAFRRIWREAKAGLPMGVVSQEKWLRIIFAAIAAVLPTTNWHVAFDSLGLLGNQNSMSQKVCEELGLAMPPQVPRGVPSAAQAALVFPSGMKVDVMTWVHFVPKSALKGLAMPAAAHGPGAARPAASASSASGSSVAPTRRGLPASVEPVHWYRGRPVRDLR